MEIKQIVKYIGYENVEYDTEEMALESFKLAEKREDVLRHLQREMDYNLNTLQDIAEFFVDNYNFERKK